MHLVEFSQMGCVQSFVAEHPVNAEQLGRFEALETIKLVTCNFKKYYCGF